ncbi:pentatricopeptide repeat protein [Purpureocillium lavendulum]|uniref:Pentatricopeptide repeat protein n=1 Tax=Purpureocillium lavendulum TaxID=1247861 RepID=A0AB34G140_9HYPO|nr:pentatricopeptide repeat protein [Purpureocillium lavendulum]
MRGSQFIYDGLWRCLCPAFDRAALHRVVGPRSFALARPTQRVPSARCPRLVPSRQYATSADGPGETVEAPTTKELRPRRRAGVPREQTWEDRLLAPTPPTEDALQHVPVDDIVAALVAMRDPRGWSFHGQDIDRHGRILQLVRHLLGVRGQPASPFVYECVMDAMASPRGSAEGVRKLLDDLAQQGMKPTAAMCQGALAALANHPDYALRQEILTVMQEFWFTVNTPAKQSVVLGLLRDEQYELAYARLTELIETGARIDPWVYDIFIMVFGKLGFLDEMLQLLYRRKSTDTHGDVVTSLHYFTLDVCSEAFYYAGTMFAWNAVVRNSLLQPPDGVVENVLATAARHGDASLATETLDLIAQRTRVMAYHYEAVAEAFARAGDMAGALRILSIMKRNGIRVARGNTRMVYEALKDRPRLVQDAEGALRSLGADGLVPLAVVSVVMEAMSELGGSEGAMALYRDVSALCGEQPDSSMLQTLMVNSREQETKRSLARDYMASIAEEDDAVRSWRVYEELIPSCAQLGELDLAFRFARQAASLPTVSGGGTAAATRNHLGWLRRLVESAVEREDGRIWEVVDQLSKRGDAETTAKVQKMLQQTRLARRVGELPRRA